MAVLFSLTIFLGAFLLFSLQPLVGKVVLPSLGGSPAIWNTCLLFFQAALLAGYVYAFIIQRFTEHKKGLFIHFTLLGLALLSLPFNVGQIPLPADGLAPALWLLFWLGVNIALAFVIVASTAPLVQSWFSITKHKLAGDPYFLYAASNSGSFIALFAYPFLIEPGLTLPEQSVWWKNLYLLFIALMFACALWASISKRGAAMVEKDTNLQGLAKAISKKDLFIWLLLAFIPTSMMMGVTSHITENVAAVPLIWIVPLALFLLTYIMAFSRYVIVPHHLLVRFMPLVMIPFIALLFTGLKTSILYQAAIHLFALFWVAMVCHGELAARRPDPLRLTLFYLLISLGGVLGGIFNALLAPLIFSGLVEYPLIVALALFIRSGPASLDEAFQSFEKFRSILRQSFSPFALMLAAFFISLFVKRSIEPDESIFLAISFGIPAIVLYYFRNRILPFAIGYGLLLASAAYLNSSQDYIEIRRNFFGVKKVSEYGDDFRALIHGSTLHGVQSLRAYQENLPLSYYHPAGPVGDVFSLFLEHHLENSVAVVGLGIGSMLCYAKEGEIIDAYEIDPQVIELASDERFFTFLKECPAYRLIIGDGRLTLRDIDDAKYQLMFIDAFTSNAIPLHLLTKEAILLYQKKLRSEGILVFHISNRFLDLEPVLANAAKALGLRALIKRDVVTDGTQSANYFPNWPNISLFGSDRERSPSIYLAMTTSEAKIDRLIQKGWSQAQGKAELGVWTDSYSNIFSVLRRR